MKNSPGSGCGGVEEVGLHVKDEDPALVAGRVIGFSIPMARLTSESESACHQRLLLQGGPGHGAAVKVAELRVAHRVRLWHVEEPVRRRWHAVLAAGAGKGRRG